MWLLQASEELKNIVHIRYVVHSFVHQRLTTHRNCPYKQAWLTMLITVKTKENLKPWVDPLQYVWPSSRPTNSSELPSSSFLLLCQESTAHKSSSLALELVMALTVCTPEEEKRAYYSRAAELTN